MTSAKKIRRTTTLLTLVVVILIAVAGYYVIKSKASIINSYKECVSKGYPVLQTYPEVCKVPDGKSFTNPADLRILFPGENCVQKPGYSCPV
jgi:hypothetical protein